MFSHLTIPTFQHCGDGKLVLGVVFHAQGMTFSKLEQRLNVCFFDKPVLFRAGSY
jgi:hypothetical protein